MTCILNATLFGPEAALGWAAQPGGKPVGRQMAVRTGLWSNTRQLPAYRGTQTGKSRGQRLMDARGRWRRCSGCRATSVETRRVASPVALDPASGQGTAPPITSEVRPRVWGTALPYSPTKQIKMQLKDKPVTQTGLYLGCLLGEGPRPSATEPPLDSSHRHHTGNQS